MVPSRKFIRERIPAPTGDFKKYSKFQSSDEIIQCVYDSVKDSQAYTANYAFIFAYKNTYQEAGQQLYDVDGICCDIWDFMQDIQPYSANKAEGEELQTGRTVRYIIYDPSGVGRKTFDCKHYAIFAYATLQALNIPCQLCLTAYNGDAFPTHIYVVAFGPKGERYVIDGTMPDYNQESTGTTRYTVKVTR